MINKAFLNTYKTTVWQTDRHPEINYYFSITAIIKFSKSEIYQIVNFFHKGIGCYCEDHIFVNLKITFHSN